MFLEYNVINFTDPSRGEFVVLQQQWIEKMVTVMCANGSCYINNKSKIKTYMQFKVLGFVCVCILIKHYFVFLFFQNDLFQKRTNRVGVKGS